MNPKNIKTKKQAEAFLNQLSNTLEECFKSLKVQDAVITEQCFLILTFLINNERTERVVYLKPSLWLNSTFFDVSHLLIEQIDQSFPTPKSIGGH